MPLYHFDLVNTKTIGDAGRVDLRDDIDALDIADAMASHILQATSVAKPSLRNPNDDGDEVCLPLDIIH